jgi:hypothetical protein
MTRIVGASSFTLSIALALLLPACGDDSGSSDTGTPVDTGITDTGTASDTGTTSDTGTASDTGTTSDTAPPTDGATSSVYEACNFDPMPRCDPPYDLCNVFGGGSAPHHCTYTCESVDTCPAPETGTATPVCEPGNGPENVCKLDCTSGTCPEGMACIGTGAAGETRRCAFNP